MFKMICTFLLHISFLNEKRKLINKCGYFLIKKLVMFLSFSVIFLSCTDKCLAKYDAIRNRS